MLPHIGKVGRVGSVFRMDAMYAYIPVAILVVFGSYEPGVFLFHFALFDYADASFADGGGLRHRCFEINGYEIDVVHVGFVVMS